MNNVVLKLSDAEGGIEPESGSRRPVETPKWKRRAWNCHSEV